MSKHRSGPDGLNFSNTKRVGERSEAAFLYQASQRGFAICKPWGDSERYDFIIDNRPQPVVHLFRIQIKCTDSLRAGAYETRATYELAGRHIPYTKRDIDFVAAHIVPLRLWYIIPVEICTPQPMLRFYPHRQAKKMRLESYKEAWNLLDPPIPNPPITIQACIDENYPEGYEPEADCIEEGNPEDDDPNVP
jgi:PD-(D/E)XK endonuclease